MQKNIEKYNKEELLIEFAEQLPTIRKILGVSQSEMGRKVGLSRQSISSIERGNVALTWNTLLAILLVVLVNSPDCFGDIMRDERFSLIAETIKLDSKLEEA